MIRKSLNGRFVEMLLTISWLMSSERHWGSLTACRHDSTCSNSSECFQPCCRFNQPHWQLDLKILPRVESHDQISSGGIEALWKLRLRWPSPCYTDISALLIYAHLCDICNHVQAVSIHHQQMLRTKCWWNDSGVTRVLGRSAIRPTATRRAFEPLRKQAVPAVTTRFASTEAQPVGDGKIHQVIGAVVDGKSISSLSLKLR